MPPKTQSGAAAAVPAKKRVSFGGAPAPTKRGRDAAPAAAAAKAPQAQVVVPAARPAKKQRAEPAKAKAQPKGAAAAKAAPAAAKKAAKSSRDAEDDDESSMSSSSSDDDDLLSASSSDDEDEKTAKTGSKSKRPFYEVVQLRYLPPQFQEPQICKFIAQFGTAVADCFCVRQKRSKQSKGIAYVHLESASVLPLVIEEMNGMSLGGRTVRARIVRLHRPMPDRKVVRKRRLEGRSIHAYGTRLSRFSAGSGKDAVAAIIKYARTEAKHNATLAKMGIAYSFTGFAEQLKRVPKASFKTNAALKTERDTRKKAKAAEKAKTAEERAAKMKVKREKQAVARKERAAAGGKKKATKKKTPAKPSNNKTAAAKK